MLGLTHAERNAPEDTKRVVEQLRKNGTVDNLFSQVLRMLLAQQPEHTSASTWLLLLHATEAHASAAAAAAGPERPVSKRECWANASACMQRGCVLLTRLLNSCVRAGGVQVRGAAVSAEAQAPGRG